MALPKQIAIVVEDELSLAIMERVVEASGKTLEISRRLVERGFGNIRRSVHRYKSASSVVPHIVLTDLDRGECAAALRAARGATSLPPSMLFRVAVREVESWVLGDRDGFADFAGIAASKVPQRPEEIEDPKQMLVNLVRRSRNRRLAAELVPAQGSSAQIGPLYNERLGEYVRTRWNVATATQACPSLRRARERIAAFMG